MNPAEPNELSRLIARLSDGTLIGEEGARLNELLRADPIAQEAYLDHLALDGWLESEFGGALPRAVPARARDAFVPSLPFFSLLRWLARPALAALLVVAGFAMGATAWAVTTRYIARQSIVRLPLAEAGFEGATAPLAQGVPTKFGAWCGDFSEQVGPQQGIMPAAGSKMLRYLRSDSEVEPADAATYVGDMFQVVDLRPWREATADGTAVAEFSASFNAVVGEEIIFQTCLWAFSGESEALPRNWSKQLREELAFGSGTVRADGDPRTWQRVTGRMIVPPDATMLVVELKVFPASRRATTSLLTFRGVYADAVELLLERGRPRPLPTDGHAGEAARAPGR